MTIVQAVLLVVLLAALIRAPTEDRSTPQKAMVNAVMYLIAIGVLLYLLLVRRLQ